MWQRGRALSAAGAVAACFAAENQRRAIVLNRPARLLFIVRQSLDQQCEPVSGLFKFEK